MLWLTLGLHCVSQNGGACSICPLGFKAWPVGVNHELAKGWDTFRRVHGLKAEFKVIMACERKLIFHTAILDGNDRKLVFGWFGPNLQWQELHPSPSVLSCLYCRLYEVKSRSFV